MIPCADLDETLSYFTARLGLRIEAIWPADEPTVAVLSGHGLRLRLDRGFSGPAGELRVGIAGAISSTETAPNGTVVVFEPVEPPMVVPDGRVNSLVVSRDNRDADTGDSDGAWVVGRASMRYRDLVPDRAGGRFIASHIHIPEGGPVPDYVHYHHIRFQLIFVRAGWVKVVYEDQGEPFVMEPGDCVLQPPLIRHRVLESSDDLEVIEIGSPAEHQTLADHDVELPTSVERPERDFGGQRFVRHRAATARWGEWIASGFESRDTGIGAATDGLANVRVVRSSVGGANEGKTVDLTHHDNFLFLFLLEGTASLSADGADHLLGAGDAVTVPAGMRARLRSDSGLEFLEVRLPT